MYRSNKSLVAVLLISMAVAFMMRSAGAERHQRSAPGNWIRLESGSYLMGSPRSEVGHVSSERLHRVTLTHDFLVQTTEVTQDQYRSIMRKNPSQFPKCGGDCPVERVNWHQAAQYCNKLSKREGFRQCYRCGMTKQFCIQRRRLRCTRHLYCELDSGLTSPYECSGYRLPTEAEWEYAARAGTTTGTYVGDLREADFQKNEYQQIVLSRNPILDPIAWHGGNSRVTYRPPEDRNSLDGPLGHGPHPVGTKQPNAWGLFDMLGNVREWCHDWAYRPPNRALESYASGAVSDPWGLESGNERINRGGSWASYPRSLRAAARGGGKEGNWLGSNCTQGFRPVRTAPSATPSEEE